MRIGFIGSTGSPTVMRRLHAAFKAKGVHVLDAPVSGGVGGARRGTLQVMVGGDEAIYNEVKDVLRAVGQEALLEAIRGASFGQGLILSQMLPEVIFKGNFDTVRFALKLARKDIGLATELARELDVPMPMAAVAEQIMMEGLARGWGDKDSTSPWMLQEEAAGVVVRETKQ